MLIFAGSYGKTLAKSLKSWQNGQSGSYEESFFKNGERKIKILSRVKGKEVWVVQDMAREAEQALIELLLLVDGLKEAGAKKIVAIVPFLAYSFQNRRFEGEPISVRVIAKMISISGIDELLLVDLHEPSSLEYFTIPVTNVSMVDIFANEIKKLKLGEDVCVIAPDKGSAKRAQKLAKITDLPLTRLTKKRNLQTLEIGGLKLIQGKITETCILIDDAVNSGRTIVEISKWLKKRGAKKVIWLVSHFMGVKGSLGRIIPMIDQLITTNSCENGLKATKKVRIIELKW